MMSSFALSESEYVVFGSNAKNRLQVALVAGFSWSMMTQNAAKQG